MPQLLDLSAHPLDDYCHFTAMTTDPHGTV